MTPEKNFESLRSGPVRMIGLVGGIASGKSTVARAFERLGATIFDADRVAHRILERREVVARIRSRWGEAVLGPGGQVDRARLGRQVFDDQGQREELEEIVHAGVFEELRREVERLASGAWASPRSPLLVVDAPLLLETGLDRACHRIVYVDTPREERLRRARDARAWDDLELERRERHQKNLDEKKLLAHEVVRGDLAPGELEAWASRFLARFDAEGKAT